MACIVDRSYLVVSFFRAYMALLLLVDTSRIGAYLYVVAYLGCFFLLRITCGYLENRVPNSG